MLAQDYNIEGTITMFSGFHFSEDSPYTYREGRRLIKILGQEFRKKQPLIKQLGIDPEGKGRPAITKGDDGSVWDFIPLKKTGSSATFTSHPHATMVIRPNTAAVAVTIPNGIKGGVKTRLKNAGLVHFQNLLERIERNLHEPIGKVENSMPLIYLLQRHYTSQRSHPRRDGIIEVDLRTMVHHKDKGFKHQSMWTEAIFNLLTNKRTNIQFGIEVRFPHAAKPMQSAKAIEVMADAWIAMRPIIDFVEGSK